MANKIYTIDKVVRQLMIEMGESTTHIFELLLPQAYSFLNEFKTTASKETKTVKLKISNLRTAKLPDDFIDYVKLGVNHGRNVRILAHNPLLSNLPECDKSNYPLYHISKNEPYYPLSKDEPYYPFIGWGEDLLGYGMGGFEDSFKIDFENGVIRFGSEVNVGNLYLEYRSNEWNPCGHTAINPMVIPVMQNYILWKYYLRRKDGMYRQYEQYYYRELTNYGNKTDVLGISDIYAGLNRNYTLYPKF